MEYKYKAFISYRHLEPDMQAAEKLQKLLESYKPPKSLGKTKENWRIFRDVSELQSSSDLSDDIKNAIESSEYLIVICSPKYTESKWCMQELSRFRELHDNTNQNIITLLVSGQPQESFPKELTYTEMTTTNEKGEKVKVQVEVEPLAANITADSLKESMKKLNTEYLRIAAPLLKCDFNDLFQREKRREAARKRRIFGGVSAVLSLITVISVYSAVTINGKNVQIQKQNSQIKEQNEEIEQKNKDLLVENAGHLAVESENLFQENSLIPAIQKAVAALPGDGEEKPVLPEAEYALSRELGSFEHRQLIPQRALRHECAVEKLSFMGSGKSVVTQDATGIYFWDAETGELIRKISASDSEFACADSDQVNKLTADFALSLDKTGTYFDYTASPGSITYEVSAVFGRIYTNYVHSVDEDEPGTGGDVYISNSDCTVWRLDGATGEVKWKAAASDKANTYYSVKIDEKYVLRLYQDKKVMPSGISFPGNDVFLEILNRETGAEVDTVRVSDAAKSNFNYLMDISVQTVRDGVIYMADSSDSTVKAYEIQKHEIVLKNECDAESPIPGGVGNITMQFVGDAPLVTSCSVLAFDTKTYFTRFDAEFSEALWRAELPLNFLSTGSVFLIPAENSGYEHDVLAVMTKTTLSFIDFEDGSVIRHIPLGSEVVDVSFTRRGLVIFTVRDGEEYVVSLGHYTTGNASDNAAFRVQKLNTAVSLCSYSLGKYVTSENYSNIAYIQSVRENPMYTAIDAGEYMFDREVLAVSADGKYAAVAATYYPDGKYSNGGLAHHLYIYDTDSKQLTDISDLKNFDIQSAVFTGGHSLIVNGKNTEGGALSDDKIVFVDAANGTANVLDAPAVKRAGVKLTATDSGAFYLSDSEKNVVFVSPDGKWTPWATSDESSLNFDKQVIRSMYAVSESKAAIFAQINGEDSKTALIVYDFAGGQTVTLDCEVSDGKGRSVERIFWQNSKTVGVFFNDRSVSLFDAASGALNTTVSLNGTGQEPVSVAAVSDDTFAVLCRDSQLYEMNASGFTGRSCRLDFKDDTDNDIRESDSENAYLLRTQRTEAGTVYVVWNDTEAWLLDLNRFTVRYRIESFACAPANKGIVFISDDGCNQAGSFPIYSTKQLLDSAKQYLSALGES